ncbi:hypothetical protein SAMN05216490_0667 [Mucilaginibacter mallensis]|uniref:Uncharacterized protein n=1 Tax=Mucilaginibacter mallensis TaxID=652787 RepID=A0A1H1Q1E7_MUCMA|nr:hypothetical protein SAMN05216490_0667 [Mucilaginibacter mallensis]
MWWLVQAWTLEPAGGLLLAEPLPAPLVGRESHWGRLCVRETDTGQVRPLSAGRD